VDAERSDLVRAYWRHRDLRRGTRAERLEADDYFWAWEAVDEAAREADDGVLDLLHAEHADVGYVAAGPIEDLLNYHAERFANAVAEHCRRDAAWSTALASVVYSGDAVAVEHLRPWLHPAVFERSQPRVKKQAAPAAKQTSRGSSGRGRGRRDR
jgi:hypothetical protein